MIFILILLAAPVHSKPQGSPHIQEENVQSFVTKSKITLFPYYGGAKGQSLKVTELPNGTVTMEIIKTPPKIEGAAEGNPSELEMPQLPQRPSSEFASNLKNLHKTALNIIRMQEAAKKNGQVNHEHQAEYRENLESLQLSADKLAKLYDDEDDLDFTENPDLTQWLDRKKNNKKDKKKEEERKKKEEEEKRKEEEKKKKEEEDKKKKEEEEKKRKEEEKEEESEEEGNNTESVVINLPPDEASVAEAKPVGLAVAGTGGVAASKPVATAIVGPGGLAIAHPVGTAIAGVSPDQALVPIYAEEDSKKENSKEEKKKISNTEYLNKVIQRYHKV